MSSKSLTLLLTFSILSLIGCKSQESAFTKKDIASAQKLIGLEFGEQAIDTLYQYLERNKRGYDSLRKFTTSNETFPAITFDPHPVGYEPKLGRVQHDFKIPADVEMPDNKEELAFYSIPKLASLIRSRKITSTELTELYINRIKRYDGQLLSVITITEELAFAQAKKADEEIAAGKYKGILHGIPYGVKDLISVEGYPTTWGSAPYKDQVFDYTATVVERLNEKGAILIAKLVSGALARGDVWFGGKTKNPWDLNQGASGSSAGSGSATAAGLVAFSLGTETLGSITSPATRNGVVGLRPTYGRVSRHGVMSLSWSMDKIGPLCRSVEDCQIVFDAIYGYDSKDPSTNRAEFSGIDRNLSDLKVAYLKKDIERDTTSSRGLNMIKALQTFEQLGVDPTPIELPADYPYAVFDIILRAEAGAFFDELVTTGAVDIMVEQTKGSRANSLRQSRFIPAVEYIQANRQRRRLIEEVNQLFKDYDVIIAPSFGGRQLYVTNLTGHPAISVPNGFDKKGRPTSFTLLGNLYDEGAILSMAKAFQEASDFHLRQPPLFSAKN